MAKDKNTKVVSLYLNLNNPYEKEFYSLLNKANRKKSALAGIIGHNFAQQFKDGIEGLTETDIKTYIEMYSLIQKMNMPMQQNVVNAGTVAQVSSVSAPASMPIQANNSPVKSAPVKPSVNKQEHVRHTQAVMPKMPKSKSEPVSSEAKSSEITSADMDEALNQLKAFGI